MATPITLRVRALIASQSLILICELPKRCVCFLPGGRVEPGETLDVAIRREVLEETGARVESLNYLSAIEDIWSKGGRAFHDLSHFFEVTTPSLNPSEEPICNDPGVAMRWVPYMDLAAEPILPLSLKRSVLGWLAGARHIWRSVERRD